MLIRPLPMVAARLACGADIAATSMTSDERTVAQAEIGPLHGRSLLLYGPAAAPPVPTLEPCYDLAGCASDRHCLTKAAPPR
mgnify:CR=1 FL=1